MPKTRSKLTAKQQRFVDEYLVDLNATQAAVRSGYSQRTAGKIGTENLQKPAIQQAIQAAMQKRSRRTEITADRVLNEIALLAYARMGDYATFRDDGSAVTDLSSVTHEQSAAIQELTVEEYTDGHGDDARPVKRTKLKLTDKKGALDLLGRHLGIFKDVHDVNLRDYVVMNRPAPKTTEEWQREHGGKE